MPKIIIREKDYTNPGETEYENFSVVVPGFVNDAKYTSGTDQLAVENVFDENGIIELTTVEDFENYIGFVPPVEWTYNGNTYPASYGNQMAYELLKLGYTVLYVNLGLATVAADKKSITGYLPMETAVKNLFAASAEKPILEPLVDRANYDFRFIVTGFIRSPKDAISGVEYKNAYKNALKVAEFDEVEETGRGDCFVLCDIDENAYLTWNDQGTALTKADQATIISNIAADATNYISKYAAPIAPTLCYSNLHDIEQFNDNTKMPASFHYLACFARAHQNNFKEWYATAGLTRGTSDLVVDSTSIKLGEPAINALEPRTFTPTQGTTQAASVNLIVKIRNNYYLWGNRTGYALNEDGLIASHFLNIRQLCCTLKKQIYIACRRFTFDPNSDVLWVNFCNALRPTLEAMKADQGIRDYKIIKVATTQKAMLKAKVRIVPIEAVEDFDITISLEDSLGDTSVSVLE